MLACDWCSSQVLLQLLRAERFGGVTIIIGKERIGCDVARWSGIRIRRGASRDGIVVRTGIRGRLSGDANRASKRGTGRWRCASRHARRWLAVHMRRRMHHLVTVSVASRWPHHALSMRILMVGEAHETITRVHRRRVIGSTIATTSGVRVGIAVVGWLPCLIAQE